MKTPADKECRFYYEDFHRGHNRQECRLIKRNLNSRPWKSRDCFTCVVPDILWANASEYLELTAEVKPGILGIGRRVEVLSKCTKHNTIIDDPYTGCAQCMAELPDISSLISGE